MKNWTILIAEPIPLGLTFFDAMMRAIVRASFLNNPSGGYVDIVFTSRTHCLGFLLPASRMISSAVAGDSGPLYEITATGDYVEKPGSLRLFAPQQDVLDAFVGVPHRVFAPKATFERLTHASRVSMRS